MSTLTLRQRPQAEKRLWTCWDHSYFVGAIQFSEKVCHSWGMPTANRFYKQTPPPQNWPCIWVHSLREHGSVGMEHCRNPAQPASSCSERAPLLKSVRCIARPHLVAAAVNGILCCSDMPGSVLARRLAQHSFGPGGGTAPRAQRAFPFITTFSIARPLVPARERQTLTSSP